MDGIDVYFFLSTYNFFFISPHMWSSLFSSVHNFVHSLLLLQKKKRLNQFNQSSYTTACGPHRNARYEGVLDI